MPLTVVSRDRPVTAGTAAGIRRLVAGELPGRKLGAEDAGAAGCEELDVVEGSSVDDGLVGAGADDPQVGWDGPAGLGTAPDGGAGVDGVGQDAGDRARCPWPREAACRVDWGEGGVSGAAEAGRDRGGGEPVLDPPVVDRRDDGGGPRVDDEPDAGSAAGPPAYRRRRSGLRPDPSRSGAGRPVRIRSRTRRRAAGPESFRHLAPRLIWLRSGRHGPCARRGGRRRYRRRAGGPGPPGRSPSRPGSPGRRPCRRSGCRWRWHRPRLRPRPPWP
jgi:hypothetical protein